jgi:nitrogen fixation protein FixH
VKVFIAVVLAAGLGTVVATVWVGSQVREEQVVEKPYETGLGYDADRAARASLGWTARVDEAGLAAGPSVVRFTLWDGAGAPLDGAQVTVAATRPETSRDRVTAPARALGAGRYEADLVFAAAGLWELALDVKRGGDRLVLERSVTVSATDACDLAATACHQTLSSGAHLTLDLSPRPLKAFADLAVTAALRDGAGRPIDGAEVAVSFAMPGMFMGENRAGLASSGGGRYAGKAVLVRCPSGRSDWRAEAVVRASGMAPATATFDFRVTE